MFYLPAVLIVSSFLTDVTLARGSVAALSSAAIDTSSHCGTWDSVNAGSYSLNLDQWGKQGATSGQQCANLISLSGSNVAWSTTWQWTGGVNNVKSFTNIQLNVGLNKKLNTIKSMPTSWSWSISRTTDISANVAYDIFTSNSIGGSAVHEIMVWLGHANMNPIAQGYSSSGEPIAFVTDISIAGHSWNLYTGKNGAFTVWTFIPPNETIYSFSGDLNLFLKFLTSKSYVKASQFITTAQAGSEPISGDSTTLTTSSYSLVIN